MENTENLNGDDAAVVVVGKDDDEEEFILEPDWQAEFEIGGNVNNNSVGQWLEEHAEDFAEDVDEDDEIEIVSEEDWTPPKS